MFCNTLISHIKNNGKSLSLTSNVVVQVQVQAEELGMQASEGAEIHLEQKLKVFLYRFLILSKAQSLQLCNMSTLSEGVYVYVQTATWKLCVDVIYRVVQNKLPYEDIKYILSYPYIHSLATLLGTPFKIKYTTVRGVLI